MKCDENYFCRCFGMISKNGMKPMSGIYTIKIKIDNIGDSDTWSWSNIIGITSEKYDNTHEKLRKNENYDLTDSNSYIGWSSCNEDDKCLPNGLYCGYGRKNNIFRKNNFVYQSKNDNYKHQLPPFKKGDIVVLTYNSDLYQLSFGKENDNGALNSFIKNLPKNITFYWFVGHNDDKPMSVSIC